MKAILTDIRQDDAYYNEVMDKSCYYVPNIGDEIEITEERRTHGDGFKGAKVKHTNQIQLLFLAIKYKAI